MVLFDFMWEIYFDLRVMEEVKVIEENWSGDVFLFLYFLMIFFFSILVSIRLF